MDERPAGTLRQSVEAWEREIAAYWDDVSRSPEFLTRVGRQLSASLRSRQRVERTLQAAALNLSLAYQQGERQRLLLERLQARLDDLSARLDRLERHLSDDDRHG
jgi:hypothetical protein